MLVLLALLAGPVVVFGQTLAWDPNPPADHVTRYIAHRGTASRVYTDARDVGLATSTAYAGLDRTVTNYFALQACRDEPAGRICSNLSVEISLATTSQPPAPCTYTLTWPTGVQGNGSSTGQLTLGASRSDCAWTVTNSGAWVSISPASGVGAATLSFSMQTNTTMVQRAAAVTVGNASLTLTQAAAPITPLPGDAVAPDVSLQVVRSGNSNNYTVTTRSAAADVARADVYVDGVRLAATLAFLSPYAAKVTIAVRGQHVVRVDVRDQTGNVGTATVTVNR